MNDDVTPLADEPSDAAEKRPLDIGPLPHEGLAVDESDTGDYVGRRSADPGRDGYRGRHHPLLGGRSSENARKLLTRLTALRRAARFYPMDHPAVDDAVARLGDAIALYHDEGVDVQLAFFEGEILLGSQLLAEESMLFDQLDREMRSLGIGSIVIRVGINKSRAHARFQDPRGRCRGDQGCRRSRRVGCRGEPPARHPRERPDGGDRRR